MERILNDKDLGNFRRNLAIWTCRKKAQRVKEIKEYIDLSTGEILKAKDVKVSTRDTKFMSKRAAVLDSLTSTQRNLALFILDFRNTACGFLVPVDQILDMYCKYSKQRKDNVKRSFEALIHKGVMQDKFTLAQEFMLYSKGRTSSEAKGDVIRAGIIFDVKMLEIATQNKNE